MTRHIRVLPLAIFVSVTLSGQTPPPVKIDGTGGARTAKQTRPPDNRRPRGTAVGLLGWRAGIRSDAFGAIPFLDAAARIDADGVAFVEGVSTNLDYRLNADELDTIKARLTDLGLRVPAYRSEEHTSELQSQSNLVCRLLLEKKKKDQPRTTPTEMAELAHSTVAVSGHAAPEAVSFSLRVVLCRIASLSYDSGYEKLEA